MIEYKFLSNLECIYIITRVQFIGSLLLLFSFYLHYFLKIYVCFKQFTSFIKTKAIKF